MSAPIHYIWAGPPACAPNIGQDTIGPDLAHEQYQRNQIYYWCLKAHVPHYQAVFKASKVKVLCIEDYVKSRNIDLYLLIEQLKSYATVHEAKNDRAREFTTIKALVQYYAQIEYSGYFLDTNVIPCPGTVSDTVPHWKTFSVPLVDCEDKSTAMIDPWLMYCPDDESDARNRFNFYYHFVKKEINCRESYNQLNRALLGTAFVAACEEHSYRLFHSKRTTKGSCGLGFQVPYFQKRYYNSHTKHTHSTDVFIQVISGAPSPRELQYLLKHTEDNPVRKHRYKDSEGNVNETSLLLEAIEIGATWSLEILLRYLDNIDEVYINSNGQAKTLLTACNDHLSHQILMAHYIKIKFKPTTTQTSIARFQTTLETVLQEIYPSLKRECQISRLISSKDDYVKNLAKDCQKDLTNNLKVVIEIILHTGPVSLTNKHKYLELILRIRREKLKKHPETARSFFRDSLSSEIKRLESLFEKLIAPKPPEPTAPETSVPMLQ